jgi:hypothetical protein
MTFVATIADDIVEDLSHVDRFVLISEIAPNQRSTIVERVSSTGVKSNTTSIPRLASLGTFIPSGSLLRSSSELGSRLKPYASLV